MKKKIIVILVAFLLPFTQVFAQDPITLIIKEGITKVIKAVDLKIQRLQNETIWLQHAQKTLENEMSKARLNEIAHWVEQQRTLYDDYFRELYEVKKVLAYYHKVRSITELQLALVRDYKQVYGQLQRDKHFTADEVVYMGNVYAGILAESLKNLEDVALVSNSFMTSMSDGKRMELLDRSLAAMQGNYNHLKVFSNQNIRLSLSRARDEKEIRILKSIYGLQ